MSYSEIILDQIDQIGMNKKKILDNIKILLEYMDIDNIHKIFYVYCYLLWNGYFSYNNKHVYSDIDIDYDLDYSIEDENAIFLGKGVCRQYSVFLYEILSYIKYDSRWLDIELKDSKINKLMDIKRRIDKKVANEYKEVEGVNHRIVLVDTKDSLLSLDPTNLCEQEILSNSRIFVPNGEYNVDEDNFFKSIYFLYGKDKRLSDSSTINKEILINYYDEAKNKCIKKRNIIKDFYEYTKPYYIKQKELIKMFKI